MIAKKDLKMNHRQYAKIGMDCEVIEQDSLFTTFKRPQILKEKQKQRKFTTFRVENKLLPLYFYMEDEPRWKY